MPRTFRDVKIGETFSFTFGSRNERAGWRKVSRIAYIDMRTRKRFTVGTTLVSVASQKGR